MVDVEGTEVPVTRAATGSSCAATDSQDCRTPSRQGQSFRRYTAPVSPSNRNRLQGNQESPLYVITLSYLPVCCRVIHCHTFGSNESSSKLVYSSSSAGAATATRSDGGKAYGPHRAKGESRLAPRTSHLSCMIRGARSISKSEKTPVESLLEMEARGRTRGDVHPA